MTNAWKVFQLPEKAMPEDFAALKEFLIAHHWQPVQVSAQNLQKVDTLMLQYLLAVARAWAGRNLDFEVTEVSAAVDRMLHRLGVGADLLRWKVGTW